MLQSKTKKRIRFNPQELLETISDNELNELNKLYFDINDLSITKQNIEIELYEKSSRMREILLEIKQKYNLEIKEIEQY